MHQLYPILFHPIYKEMVWGGNRLSSVYHRHIPEGLDPNKIGESWDISCRPAEMGMIQNGPHQHMAFDAYIDQNRQGVLGTKHAQAKNFPLLIKIIDANDALSIQVHPDDSRSDGVNSGKSEMWYILTPPTDGRLIIGLKPGTTKAQLKAAYENNTVEDYLHYLPVSAGDIIDIPAGLIHALTPGVMVAEVQQNSDITYRLYDYNRLGLDGQPRPLHVQEALEVSDFENKIPQQAAQGAVVVEGANSFEYPIKNAHFEIIKYSLSTPITEVGNKEAFSIFTCVSGRASIQHQADTVGLVAGSSVFLPAAIDEYCIAPDGDCVLIKSIPQ